jgi:hypothetical protein
VFGDVERAIEELGEVDLDGLGSAERSERVEGFQRLRAKLDAAEAREIARWDAERCWQADGAKSGGAWLAWRCRLPGAVANQRVRHARRVRELPEVAAAWAAGEIDRTHITTLLGCRNPRTEKAFETGHKELLDAARTRRFCDFQRVCDGWVNRVDMDGAGDKDRDEEAAREVHLSQSFQGMWFGRMTFDRVSGTIVQGTLTLFERELFDADWAEARQRLGRDPMIQELRRTPAQRRADAMVEMATRARTAPEAGRRPVPLFTVVVGYETFAGPVCELWNRTVIHPATAARWLDEADIERVVFDSPSRVIDVGSKRRFFRGGLRRAIEVRDRTCFHPTCDDVPERPEVDHIHEAAKGGDTTQTNGRLGCAFHNRRRNHHPDDWDTDTDTDTDTELPLTGPDPPDG